MSIEKKEWKEEIKERLVTEILKATNAEEVEQIAIVKSRS